LSEEVDSKEDSGQRENDYRQKNDSGLSDDSSDQLSEIHETLGRSKSAPEKGVINGGDGIVRDSYDKQIPATQTDQESHTDEEGASEKEAGIAEANGGGSSKERGGIQERVNQHGLVSLFGELKKEHEKNKSTALKNVIPGRNEDELSSEDKEKNKERTGVIGKKFVDGFDVGRSTGSNDRIKSGGNSEEQQEASPEGASESESVIPQEGSISNEEHLSRERVGSSQNQQRTSSTPGFGKEEEYEGESGKEGEKVKDQTDSLPVLGNKVPQNTALLLGEETIERREEDLKQQFVDTRPSEQEKSDKLKETPESSSGFTENVEGSFTKIDEEENTVSDPFSGRSPSSDGRPRSLETVDHPPLLVQPGLDEVTIQDEENSLEPDNVKTKEDAKKTKKKKKGSVSALPDKSGRCDHLTDENLILRCKVIACFRNVAHCYN